MNKIRDFMSMFFVRAMIMPVVIFFVACGGGGGGGDSGGTGTMSLYLTDAPVDSAERVVVAFTGVELKPAGGSSIEYYFCDDGSPDGSVSETPCTTPFIRQIDLLALEGGGSELILDQVEVPAGRYEWLRLKVNAERGVIIDDSFIEFEGPLQESLWIPSGYETGLKLVSGFVVPAGGHADFTVDFDLRKSVTNPEGSYLDYILKPALRIIDNSQVGSIAGTVDAELTEDSSCTGGNAVYVYSGHDVTPIDVRGAVTDPLTTAIVNGSYEYRAAFLPAGDYTVAFTCQADQDDPVSPDSLTFVGAANVNVVAGEETIHDFGP
jgi:hypothetical protein